jgi:hypothetical protein
VGRLVYHMLSMYDKAHSIMIDWRLVLLRLTMYGTFLVIHGILSFEQRILSTIICYYSGYFTSLSPILDLQELLQLYDIFNPRKDN